MNVFRAKDVNVVILVEIQKFKAATKGFLIKFTCPKSARFGAQTSRGLYSGIGSLLDSSGFLGRSPWWSLIL